MLINFFAAVYKIVKNAAKPDKLGMEVDIAISKTLRRPAKDLNLS